jgi:hypothetical protein
MLMTQMLTLNMNKYLKIEGSMEMSQMMRSSMDKRNMLLKRRIICHPYPEIKRAIINL